MLKSEAGNTTVFLDKKTRSQINDLRLSIRYLVEMGLKAHTGELTDKKTLALVNRLSLESQQRIRIEEENKNLMKHLRAVGWKFE